MKPFIQPNDYSCGVYALRYLLHLKGLPYRHVTQKALQTDKNGTQPTRIIDFLYTQSIKTTAIHHLTAINLPALVLYEETKWHDGHYGVIVSATEKHIYVYDPGDGAINRHGRATFMRLWESKKLEQWAIRWAVKLQ